MLEGRDVSAGGCCVVRCTPPGCGKACKDGSECAAGACLTGDIGTPAEQPAVGKCAADDNPCGCKQFVVNGVAQHALCAD